MDDDDDFLDLGEGVHDEDHIPTPDPTSERELLPSEKPREANSHLLPPQTQTQTQASLSLPSEKELILSRRILELERERDGLANQLRQLKLRYPNHAPIIPISTSDPSSSDSTQHLPIIIPQELLPILSSLQAHIADLTRDNAALRYTFIGPFSSSTPPFSVPGSTITSTGPSSKAILETPLAPPSSKIPAQPTVPTHPIPHNASGGASIISPTSGQVQSMSPQIQDGLMTLPAGSSVAPRVDLDAVVERVKTLMRENEELGEMLVQVGQGTGDEWAKVLEDSKAVIASLDTDLSHHLSVIESQRAELEKYRAAYGPVTRIPSSSNGPSASASASGSGTARLTPSSDHFPRSERDRGYSGGGGNGGGSGDRRGPRGGNGDRRVMAPGAGAQSVRRDGRDGRGGLASRIGGGGQGGSGEGRDGKEHQGGRDRDKDRPSGGGGETGAGGQGGGVAVGSGSGGRRDDLHHRIGTGSGGGLGGGRSRGAVGESSIREDDRASKRRR